MPEATEDATFLIATSWQALGRAEIGDDKTLTCNCTVVLIFAAFFVEANITHIIEKMGLAQEFSGFFPGTRHPGLGHKMSWFFNRFLVEDKARSSKELYSEHFQSQLKSAFPGFGEIYDFRNSLAHGLIDKTLANLNDAKRLRAAAKAIVEQLFEIAASNGHELPRVVTYQMAITSNDLSTEL